MDELNLIRKVQLALFHPRFVFDRKGINRINNHVNRGPYPTFHVLREDEVSAAMDKLEGNAGRVWRRDCQAAGEDGGVVQ
jgi:hypothetical protein